MMPTDPFRAQSQQNRIALTWGVVLFLTAMVMSSVTSGVVTSKATFPRALLLALHSKPEPITVSTASSNTPVTGMSATSPEVTREEAIQKMPQEVYDWLKHLESTESKLKESVMSSDSQLQVLLSELQGGALDMRQMLDSDPDQPSETKSQGKQKANEAAQKSKEPIQDIEKFFDSRQAPQECIAIRNLYAQALGETIYTVKNIQSMIEGVSDEQGSTDIARTTQKLSQIYSNHKERIDLPRKNCDDLIEEICQKYGVKKWFSIPANLDSGPSDLVRKFLGR